jgi:LacI family transcriptional regulator
VIRNDSRRATIHDVARSAGVSTASVSRALSGARKVGPDVAAKVRDAAKELGYAPDEVGRSLRKRETRTVGLVVADITNPFFPALVQAVAAGLHAAGFGLLLADASDNPQLELDSVRLLLARRVDALLITPCLITPCHRQRSRAAVLEASQQVPTVQLDRFASAAADYIGMDHDAAVRDVLDHLAATGRRHPAMIASDPHVSTAWERQNAYLRRSVSIDPTAPERLLVGTFSFDWGRQAAAEALRRWPETDALVCANDLIALGAIEQLGRIGVKVPTDVAVVGFDDTMFAILKEPSLTSVRQPLTQMARAAVDLVTGSESRERPLREKLAATLQVRDSTAAAG